MSANADGLRDALRRRSEEAYLEALTATETELVVAAPYLTGETVESAETVLGDTGPHFSAELRFTAPQALWTDEGTVPHVIEGDPWLVFDIGGQTVFVKSPAVVNHPGTQRTGWFSDNVGPTYLAALERSWAAGI